ncbi:MAG TPA: hypothetical protein PLU35_06380 [Phycisphaerales bacterium]|nr:hypothetical protein [Phycisphaerales bacterium]
MNRSRTLSLCLALAAAATSANASIVATSGLCTQIAAPPSAVMGPLNATNAWAWDEQQGISLALMPVDLSTNPSNSNAAVPGFLTGTFDSHMVHFDGPPGIVIFGTVTFKDPIVAVQYADLNLDLSDAIATTGTIYPTTMPFRGFNNWTGADFVDINGNVLTFQLSTVSPVADIEQIRVFTRAIPAPGTVALLSLAGLIAARRRRA